MWVKAWMFKWHNPNLKTGAWPCQWKQYGDWDGGDHECAPLLLPSQHPGYRRCRATAPCSAQSSLPEPTPRACSSSALPRAEVRSPEPLFQIHSNPSPPPSFFSVNLKAHSHLLQSLSHPIHPRPSLLVPRVSHSPLSPTPSCLASHPQHPFTFTPSLFTTSFVLCRTPHSLPEEHNSRWAPNSPTYADISAHFAAAAAPRPSSDLCQLSQPPKLTFSWDLAHGRLCRQAFRKPECCLHLPEVCRGQLWSN